jgi:hypothetical protein
VTVAGKGVGGQGYPGIVVPSEEALIFQLIALDIELRDG